MYPMFLRDTGTSSSMDTCLSVGHIKCNDLDKTFSSNWSHMQRQHSQNMLYTSIITSHCTKYNSTQIFTLEFASWKNRTQFQHRILYSNAWLINSTSCTSKKQLLGNNGILIKIRLVFSFWLTYQFPYMLF